MNADTALDNLENAMATHELMDLPLSHTFTPGLYGRKIFMPAGTMLTSRVHRTRHQYTVLRGSVSVWTAGEGWRRLEAGHSGVTEPGTRRLLYIHEDCEWMTFHPVAEMGVDLSGLDDAAKVALIEATIVEPLGDHLRGLLPEGKWPRQEHGGES